MVGDAIPGLLVLGSLRKQAEQTFRNKPVSSTSPQPLHQLLLPGSYPVDRGFCHAQSHSHSVPTKHTEAYINYKLVGLLAQAYY